MVEQDPENPGVDLPDTEKPDLSSESSIDCMSDDFDGNVEDFLHVSNEINLDDENQFDLLCDDLFGDLQFEEDLTGAVNSPIINPPIPVVNSDANPQLDDPFRALGDEYINDSVNEPFIRFNYTQFRAKVDPDYEYELKDIHSTKPQDFFTAYISPSYIASTATATDLNGYLQCPPSFIWKRITPAEIKVFLVVLMIMASRHEPKKKDYFDTNTGCPIIINAMTYKRFAKIYKYLQVPRDANDNSLSKHINSMYKYLNSTIKKNVDRPLVQL